MCNNPLKQWEVGTDGQTYDFGYVQSVPQFIEEVYEIAFGDNAINRDFSMGEVLDQLMQYSDDALRFHGELDSQISVTLSVAVATHCIIIET